MPDNEKLELIECPNCGAEYLPVEIYLPNVFFGRPTHIRRDENHKIIDVIGSHTNTDEHFVCEYCHKPFKVKARLQFNTKIEAKFDFDNDYSTKLKKEKLFMVEE